MTSRLPDRVYDAVIGTTPDAQAVLAYLANEAENAGTRTCSVTNGNIVGATHLRPGAVEDAIQELQERVLVSCTSDGYDLHVPESRSNATTKQGPSVTPPISAEEKSALEKRGAQWSATQKPAKQHADKERDRQKKEFDKVVDKFLNACEIPDKESRKIVMSALVQRNMAEARTTLLSTPDLSIEALKQLIADAVREALRNKGGRPAKGESGLSQKAVAQYIFGPPCNEAMVSNWERYRRELSTGKKNPSGAIPPCIEVKKGIFVAYDESMRKNPIGANILLMLKIAADWRSRYGHDDGLNPRGNLHYKNDAAIEGIKEIFKKKAIKAVTASPG